MKLLKPSVYLLVASVIQPALAVEDFRAYRLGNYEKMGESLTANKDNKGVADFYLGHLYLYGYGQLKNSNLALRYFMNSAEKGYLPAQQIIAKYALLRENNPEKALQWFKKAAAQGDMNAKMFVAAAYIFGVGTKQNPDAARQYYIDSAKNGNPIAQYTLAKHFLDSKQMANKKLGLIWLNKAVQASNPKALTKMAQLALEGKLVTKDEIFADKLLNAAVAKNYAPAMVFLGKLALDKKDYPLALNWYEKAAHLGYQAANVAQAQLFLLESTPLYNQQKGFLLMLKAAQLGYAPAELGLAELYKKGIGVPEDLQIAEQWQVKAKLNKANKAPIKLAAAWLSGGLTHDMAATQYQLGGIFNHWKNPNSLKEQNYNPAPKRATINRALLFKPQFILTEPNKVSINTYYDALIDHNPVTLQQSFIYPNYAFNNDIEAILESENFILNPPEIILPYRNNYPIAKEEDNFLDFLPLEYKNVTTAFNYASILEKIENSAILGNAEAQFELGQLYEHGVAVLKNEEQAIMLYQNAIEQQHEGAEYTLGLLYLNKNNPQDKKKGQDLLLSAAFKGNEYAQFVLANLLPHTEKDQAIAMQYLAASNGYGLAQYALAEYLVKEKVQDLTVSAQQERSQRIRKLYASAAQQGIAEAVLPLAFYNAMDGNKNLQIKAFQVALEQAHAGDGKAALLTGLLYDRGIGTEKNTVNAMYWYQQADVNAVRNFILGTYTSLGQGVAANLERGKELLVAAAQAKFAYADLNLAVLAQQNKESFLPELIDAYQLGNNKAGILLADYYLSEHSDLKKLQEAKNIYVGLANKGDQFAQLKLAYMFAEGLAGSINWQEASKWYTLAADQGNPEAQYLLAELYQRGVLGEPDYGQAITLYTKSASQFSNAYVALGFLYETVFDDYPKAFEAYSKAAETGNVYGQYNLALMLELGKGRAEDYAKAGVLYEQAALQNFSPAMNQLAGLYFTGLGRDKNEQQALHWYKKAAELGNLNALYMLALFSETGIGTQLSFNNALEYYQKAADKGHEKAMLALARMYYYGLGVAKNDEIALKYYEILANKNNSYAQFQLAKKYLEQKNQELLKKGYSLLEQASENGNQAASILLQKLEAKKQDKVSYVEPILLNIAYPFLASQSASHLYFNVLNAWNRGDETLSRVMLNQLRHTHPDFVPARKAAEKLEA